MEAQENGWFDEAEDFPHEELLNQMRIEHGIKVTDLSAKLQRAIQFFDNKYNDAYLDSELSEEEEKELNSISLAICEAIKKEAGGDKTGALVVGVVSGLIGTFLGIKLAKS